MGAKEMLSPKLNILFVKANNFLVVCKGVLLFADV